MQLVPIGHVAEGAAQQELYLAISLPSSLLPPGALPSPGMEGAELPIVRVLPDTPLARAHVASVYRSLYFWVDTSKAEGAGSGQVPSLQVRQGCTDRCSSCQDAGQIQKR